MIKLDNNQNRINVTALNKLAINVTNKVYVYVTLRLAP